MESAMVPSQSKRYASNDPAGNCSFNAGLLLMFGCSNSGGPGPH
jgi:hypothetical protein